MNLLLLGPHLVTLCLECAAELYMVQCAAGREELDTTGLDWRVVGVETRCAGSRNAEPVASLPVELRVSVTVTLV